MGDIKKIRKKYQKPGHPWQKSRIEEEVRLIKEYGLKNKRDMWRSSSFLKKFTAQAKKLIAARGLQSEKEKQQLMNRLQRLGLVKGTVELDAVLGLRIKDILNRRLQTIVWKKGFARSAKQARQFITHKHIQVNNKTICSPAYIVPSDDENKVQYHLKSNISNPDHPERSVIKKIEVKE